MSAPRWKSVKIDEVEALAGPGTLTWRPLRHELGVQAFGVNAYTASEIGQEVVEPHDEKDLGHEELYVVVAGHATFTLDGATLEAPAGTCVFIPDPAVHRHAHAREVGTTVIAIGGWADRAYEVSAWEWAFRGLGAAKTDTRRGREIFLEAMAALPDNRWLPYNLACMEALAGNPDAAIGALSRAVELGGDEVREWARNDHDLDRVRSDPRFVALIT